MEYDFRHDLDYSDYFRRYAYSGKAPSEDYAVREFFRTIREIQEQRLHPRMCVTCRFFLVNDNYESTQYPTGGCIVNGPPVSMPFKGFCEKYKHGPTIQ